jgi:hypothetical protein
MHRREMLKEGSGRVLGDLPQERDGRPGYDVVAVPLLLPFLAQHGIDGAEPLLHRLETVET